MTRQLRRHWIATVAAIGFVVSALGIFTLASPPIEDIGTWQTLGSLLDAREGATATRLDDGRVLVVGGQNASGVLRSAEIVGADGSTAAVANLTTPRAFHTATLLKDGRVLVTGGISTDDATASAEIFDPGSGGWTSISMTEARAHHTATMVESGVVVIAGGEAKGVVSKTTEAFDPAANMFYGLPSLASARSYHAAAQVDGGRVLVMGGTDGTHVFATTEVIDATTGLVWGGPSMNFARKNFTATSMLNGDILVAGGSDGNNEMASAEKFSLGAWGQVGGLAIARQGHAAVRLLENGGVLVVGGTAAGVPMIGAELFRPTAASFVSTGATSNGHAAGALSSGPTSGHAIVAGGAGTSSLERYAYATVKTDRDDYAPGETVTITGTGWVPGEWVTLTMIESPYWDSHPLLSVRADASGNIISTEFSPDEHDINIRFYLTAYGSQSEAQNTFTDGPKVGSVAVGTQSPNPVTAGGPASYTITVNRGTGNGGFDANLSVTTALPTGVTASFSPSTLNFKNSDNSLTATLTITTTVATPAGTTNFTVKADTSATDLATNTGSLSVLAASVATTTSVSSSANPSIYGSPVAFTATVGPSSGTTAPTGTVQFVVDGVNFGSPVTLAPSGSNGIATSASTSTLTVAGSPHTVTANFTGSGIFTNSGGSLSGGQAVSKATLTVTADAKTKTYGDSNPTFTASYSGFQNGETLATSGVTGSPSLTTTATSTSSVGGSPYAITAATGTLAAGNYQFAFANGQLTITKASSTTTVTCPASITYSGVAQMPCSVTVTGAGGLSLTPTASYQNNTNAGTATASYNFADDGNHTASSDSKNFTINKAGATVVVTPYSLTYDGQPHTATYTITGVNGETGATVGTVTLNTTHTAAGTYATDTWSFTGAANYQNIASTTITDTINKADATVVVTPYSLTYDGQPHTATYTITGVNGETGATVGTVTLNTTHSNVGTYNTDNWSFTGGANYKDIAGTTITDTITKAAATVNVTPYTVAYDGQPHTATFTITGVNGETGATVGTVTLNTTHTAAGTYASDSWSFTGAANYQDIASTTITDTISKATATVVVTPYSVTYDGQPHTATYTIAGVGGETGATVGTVTLNTTHTSVGTYSGDSWSFAGAGNYEDIASTTITDTISKAAATVVVTPYSVTYDGQPHTATYTITGVNGETGATVGTVTLNTTHTAAGTYASDTWSFTGTANYSDISVTTITDTINKADATVSVTGYTGVYDAAAHGATGTATGVGGVDLSEGLDLGATFTNVPGGTAHWTFTGGTNYKDQSGDATVTITKAAAVISVVGFSGVYDGNPHGVVTQTATGVKAETLTGLAVDATTYTNVPGGLVHWTFTNVNYADQNGDATVTITKAAAVINVTGFSGVYDGNAHGVVTQTATGVKSEALTGLAVDATTYTNVPGGLVHWTFTNANYADQNGDATVAITKAAATISVVGFSGVYDGNPHGVVTQSATGVKAEALTGLSVDATTYTNVPGGLVHWTFTNANYADQNGDATVTITKAAAVINVTGFSGAYDGNPHGVVTETATGVKAETLTGLAVDATTYTNVPGGLVHWTFTNANYADQSGDATVTITKAAAVINVTGFSGMYDGNAHGVVTQSATGVKAEALTGLAVDATTYTNVPGGLVHWTFTNANYADQSGDAPVTITKAAAVINVTGFSGAYDGNPHGVVTQTATGVKSEALTGLAVDATTYTNVPGGLVHWTFTNANYADQSGDAPVTITKAAAVISVVGFNEVYDGNPHGVVTQSATGVKAEALTGLAVDATTYTNVPGGLVHWTFTNANYADQSGDATVTITKAAAVISVVGFNGVYDGNAHGVVTQTATGVKSEALTGLAVDATTYTNVPGGLVHWTFTNANYADQNGDATVTITKAAAVIDVTGFSGMYDGNAHGVVTQSATGVKAEALTGLAVDATTYTNVPGGLVHWTFTNANYADQNGDATVTITKAAAVINVTGFSGAYDGNPHGVVTQTATGVQSEALSGLSVNATTYTNVPGGMVHWTFTNANYADQSGDAPVTITKAAAVINVTGFSGAYDGNPHGVVTQTATGVKSEALTGLSVNATTYTNVPGGMVHWTFTNANYADQSGDATVTITKAAATVIVTPYSVTYNGQPHTATYTIAGVNGEAGATVGTVTLNTTHTNPGQYASDTWSFAGAGNYKDIASTTITDAITYGACSAAVGPGGVILAPINSDGTSVYNRKGGSTIPVKFRVCDATGNPISNPAAVFAGTGGSLSMLSAVRGTVDDANESAAADVPDVAFRYSGGQWIFNMATSNLTAGSTYTFRINLANGTILFTVGVK